MTWRPDLNRPYVAYDDRVALLAVGRRHNGLNTFWKQQGVTPPMAIRLLSRGIQVNCAFSVEKGDSDLAFTTRDRVNKEEVRHRAWCVVPPATTATAVVNYEEHSSTGRCCSRCFWSQCLNCVSLLQHQGAAINR